jgi:hypothetical protein
MTPVFRPSVQPIQIQPTFLHQETLDLSSRPEGVVGIRPGDATKTLFLTVQVQEEAVFRLSDSALLQFKEELVKSIDTRLKAALGLSG